MKERIEKISCAFGRRAHDIFSLILSYPEYKLLWQRKENNTYIKHGPAKSSCDKETINDMETHYFKTN